MIRFEYVTVPHHLKLNRFIAIKQGWSPWFRMQQLCLLDVMQPECSNILSNSQGYLGGEDFGGAQGNCHLGRLPIRIIDLHKPFMRKETSSLKG